MFLSLWRRHPGVKWFANSCCAEYTTIMTVTKTLKWKWSDHIFSHTRASLSTAFVSFITHSARVREIGREKTASGLGAKLFHRTHAWATSLFLEVDGVFSELILNLRNGDSQPAKTTRGENKLKLIFSLRPQCKGFPFYLIPGVPLSSLKGPSAVLICMGWTRCC